MFSGTSKVHWQDYSTGQTLCQTPPRPEKGWTIIEGDSMEVECKRCIHLLGAQAGNPKKAPGTMTISDALQIATSAHRFQKDKAGRPYIEHLLAVQKGVQVLGIDPHEEIAALLHDIVEDTKWTIQDLREAGCPEPSLAIIEALTKRLGEEQNVYLARIVKAGHGACRVKLADVLNNTRHDRMEALPGFQRDRLLLKYRPVIVALMLELKLIVTQEGQQKLAKKPKGSSTGYSGFNGTGSSSYTYALKDAIVGEWPMKFKAPILANVPVPGGRLFVLANGTGLYLTEKEAEEKQYLRPLTQWTAVKTSERKEFKSNLDASMADDRLTRDAVIEWRKRQLATTS